MEELDNLVAESIDRYFTILSTTGYYNQLDVNKLIALLDIKFVIDLFSEYITDDDLRALTNALYCVGGNCLIDYPRTLSQDSLYHDIKTRLELRVTEDESTRVLLTDLFRIKD